MHRLRTIVEGIAVLIIGEMFLLVGLFFTVLMFIITCVWTPVSLITHLSRFGDVWEYERTEITLAFDGVIDLLKLCCIEAPRDIFHHMMHG